MLDLYIDFIIVGYFVLRVRRKGMGERNLDGGIWKDKRDVWK